MEIESIKKNAYSSIVYDAHKEAQQLWVGRVKLATGIQMS